jgi:hypothetical protein
MKIAFKKNPETLIEKSICWWTASPYFHVEIIFESGISFSAYPEKNRTAFTKHSFDLSCWDIIDIPTTEEEDGIIFQWCLSEDKCGYDWSGIFLTQIIPLSFQSRTRWFCSEVCLAALQQIGKYPNLKAYHYHPGKLHRLLTNTK